MGIFGAAKKGLGMLGRMGKSKPAINRRTGKPFSKSIQDHMKAGDKRRTGMKKAGYKGPKHQLYMTKKPGSYRMREVWTYNPYKKATPHAKRNLKKVVKEVAPVAAAGAIGVAYGGRDKKFGGGRIGFKEGKSAVSKSGGITHKSQSGIGPSKKSQKKYYDKQRDAVREMNMSGRGKQLRYESFTDRKTGRLVPDTERNRERYGKDRIYKSPEKITKIWKKGKPTYKATNKGKG